jgi:hypothetical protein
MSEDLRRGAKRHGVRLVGTRLSCEVAILRFNG